MLDKHVKNRNQTKVNLHAMQAVLKPMKHTE